MFLNMRDAIAAYLDGAIFQESTRERYRYALRQFDRWLERDGTGFDQVAEATILRFLRAHDWSANMRRATGVAIRSFYRWLRHDPGLFSGLPMPRDDAPAGRALTSFQLATLLDYCDDSPKGARDRAMISLMAETGLRASEVCRLDLSGLDLQRCYLRVIAKRGVWREGRYSPSTRQALERWLTARRGVALRGETAVFVSVGGIRPGTAMTRYGLKKLFRDLGIDAGIGRFSPHDMRRTMATLYTDAGAPTRWVMEAGAWRDIRMVVRYTRTLRVRDVSRWSPITRIERGDIPED